MYESLNKPTPTPENANDFSISKPGVRVFKSTFNFVLVLSTSFRKGKAFGSTDTCAIYSFFDKNG